MRLWLIKKHRTAGKTIGAFCGGAVGTAWQWSLFRSTDAQSGLAFMVWWPLCSFGICFLLGFLDHRMRMHIRYAAACAAGCAATSIVGFATVDSVGTAVFLVCVYVVLWLGGSMGAVVGVFVSRAAYRIVLRTGPMCPRCGYCLIGLTRLICPECGRGFTLDEIECETVHRSKYADSADPAHTADD